jgi:hypothetical protein
MASPAINAPTHTRANKYIGDAAAVKTNFIYLPAAGENKKQNHPPLAHKMKEYNSARADDDAVIIMITRPIYLRCIVLTGGGVNYALTAGVLLAERFQNKPASRSLAHPLLRVHMHVYKRRESKWNYDSHMHADTERGSNYSGGIKFPPRHANTT